MSAPKPEYGAHYRCMKCGNEFIGYAGPQAFGAGAHKPACTSCDSLYVVWVNYEEMAVAGRLLRKGYGAV